MSAVLWNNHSSTAVRSCETIKHRLQSPGLGLQFDSPYLFFHDPKLTFGSRACFFTVKWDRYHPTSQGYGEDSLTDPAPGQAKTSQQGAGVAVEQVKHGCRFPPQSLHFPSSTQLMACGKQETAQMFRPLSPTWETWVKFQAPGCGLAQAWSVQPFESETVGGSVCSLPLP